MKILGIETSCDETASAIIECYGLKILSNVVHSQIELHKKWGGVYPTLAKREHSKNLLPVLIKALKEGFGGSKFKIQNFKLQTPKIIDAIAVTIGPGLEPCLWQGINFAKELAEKWQLPLIPVNHIEAHIISNFICQNSNCQVFSNPESDSKLFPAVALIVSGGHTQLILVEKIGQYKLLGETRDDAAGECFDKCARILGLSYPGGPAIAKLAQEWKLQSPISKLKIKLPRPMIYSKDYDFSFSGLKTAVLYDWQKRPDKIKKSKEYVIMMAKEIQQAIVEVLVAKTIQAAHEFKVKSIILGGGVAANKELRSQFKLKIESCKLKINFLVPPENLCTDNAAMVAATGCFYYEKFKTKSLKEVFAQGNLSLSEKEFI